MRPVSFLDVCVLAGASAVLIQLARMRARIFSRRIRRLRQRRRILVWAVIRTRPRVWHHRANPLHGLVAFAVALDDHLRPIALVDHAADLEQPRPALRRCCGVAASAVARRARGLFARHAFALHAAEPAAPGSLLARRMRLWLAQIGGLAAMRRARLPRPTRRALDPSGACTARRRRRLGLVQRPRALGASGACTARRRGRRGRRGRRRRFGRRRRAPPALVAPARAR